GYHDPNWPIIDYEPRPLGPNSDYWNGRDPNGDIVDINAVNIAIWTRALPDDPIIVLSELRVNLATDPYSIIPSYGEFTTITYNISETADVTVSIFDPDGTLVKDLEDTPDKPAGTYELTWDGKDSSGKIISKEGNFTIKVTAIDAGNKTKTALGNVSVH
ncbi:MAG: hypothetical protein FJZ11_06020, partial [Candidatus Omnitrophica bacterium]|nr:hypothetical protein [Candidatus Omnitrophota bacterium]